MSDIVCPTASFLATAWWFQVLIISKCMQIYMHAVFAACHIYAQHREDAAKTRGWRPCIMELHS